MDIQVDLQRDMAKAFEDRDEDIVDELDDLERMPAADLHLLRTTVIDAAATDSSR